MKKFSFLSAVLVAGVMVGCGDSGNAGMTQDDAKSAISQMKPEDKIRAISSSPMPGPQKEAEYKKIEAETGVKAADVLGNQPKGLGAGG